MHIWERFLTNHHYWHHIIVCWINKFIASNETQGSRALEWFTDKSVINLPDLCVKGKLQSDQLSWILWPFKIVKYKKVLLGCSLHSFEKHEWGAVIKKLCITFVSWIKLLIFCLVQLVKSDLTSISVHLQTSRCTYR